MVVITSHLLRNGRLVPPNRGVVGTKASLAGVDKLRLPFVLTIESQGHTAMVRGKGTYAVCVMSKRMTYRATNVPFPLTKTGLSIPALADVPGHSVTLFATTQMSYYLLHEMAAKIHVAMVDFDYACLGNTSCFRLRELGYVTRNHAVIVLSTLLVAIWVGIKPLLIVYAQICSSCFTAAGTAIRDSLDPKTVLSRANGAEPAANAVTTLPREVLQICRLADLDCEIVTTLRTLAADVLYIETWVGATP